MHASLDNIFPSNLITFPSILDVALPTIIGPIKSFQSFAWVTKPSPPLKKLIKNQFLILTI